MKYRLMPYIYAQTKECTEKGLPMLRALCIEYPTDPAVDYRRSISVWQRFVGGSFDGSRK